MWIVMYVARLPRLAPWGWCRWRSTGTNCRTTTRNRPIRVVQRGQALPKGWLFGHKHILHGKNTRQGGVKGIGYFWIASREGG